MPRGSPGPGEPEIRQPRPEDGPLVHALIARCPPLDPNSAYCNLLQCTHFAATSALACSGADVIGFVSGHRLPDAPEVLFIWQVAVDARARGRGLARRMLHEILERPSSIGIALLETSITASNAASWAMFRQLARELGAETETGPLFDRDRHFASEHDSEILLTIGPFTPAAARGQHSPRRRQ